MDERDGEASRTQLRLILIRGFGPSYIPSRTFALALLDIIAPASPAGPKSIQEVRDAVDKLPPDSDIRRSLLVLIDDAGDNLDKVQDNIEIWFNNAMDR